jgi:hypothetical protein
MFRRQTIECGTQVLQIGRNIFIGYFGEFVVKQRLRETLD